MSDPTNPAPPDAQPAIAFIAPERDLRLPASVSIGLFDCGSSTMRDAALALGSAIQQQALSTWGGLFKVCGAPYVADIVESAASIDYDVILMLEPAHRAAAERIAHAAPRTMFVELDDPKKVAEFRIYSVGRNERDRLALIERKSDSPLQALCRLVFRPPGAGHGAACLKDFIGEAPPPPKSRLEYDIMLRLLGPKPKPNRRTYIDPWNSAEFLVEKDNRSSDLKQLKTLHDQADALAVYYGDSWRSTVVARSSLLLAPVIVSGAIGVLAPGLSSLTALAQVAILIQIYLDRRRASRERWQEKWIDYRDLAERLRCARFLWLCDADFSVTESDAEKSWSAWYALRIQRSLARKSLTEAECSEHLRHLLDAEIRHQIDYHRTVVRRSYTIDIRLRRLAQFITIAAAAVGAAILTAGLLTRGVHAIPWPILTSLGLTIAPSVVADLNNLRNDFDLIRQEERSARAASGLSRIVRETEERHVGPDMVRRVAINAARLMIGDAALWRSALELRATKLRRRL